MTGRGDRHNVGVVVDHKVHYDCTKFPELSTWGRPAPPRCYQTGPPETRGSTYAWSAPLALVLPRHMLTTDPRMPGSTHAGIYMPGSTLRGQCAGRASASRPPGQLLLPLPQVQRQVQV